MHGPNLDNQPKHSLCPQCADDVQGEAACVVVGHGVRTIHYICTVCDCEWHQAVLLADGPAWLFVRPRPT